MHTHSAAAATILIAMLSLSCSDTDARITAAGPSGLAFSAAANTAAASVDPAFVSAQPIRSSGCPAEHPLRARFNLVLESRGDVAFSLLEVRMRFADRAGITAPQVTLPAPVLSAQFGTALVEARSSRRFPLDFHFGCGTAREGTIVVSVRTRDGRGREDDMEVRVGVR